jgi:hypothetical protein
LKAVLRTAGQFATRVAVDFKEALRMVRPDGEYFELRDEPEIFGDMALAPQLQLCSNLP